MLPNIFRNIFRLTPAAIAASMALASCSSWIYDDMDECPAQLSVKFQYSYTLDRGEVTGNDFAQQVRSVNVWAFDEDGDFVWAGSASGEQLAEPGFKLDTPLGQGIYDFVAWCGLESNDDFSLANYAPKSKQELEVKLNTIEKEGKSVSESHLKNLYHGYKSGFQYTVDPDAPSISTVVIPLMKDNNDIAVMLVNEDGTTLNEKDFTVSFTYADSWLAWDNAVMASSPAVTYSPWSILYGETTKERAEADSPVRSTLLYEMSTSRLMAGGDAYLDVVRNTDGVRIIHLRLIDYFIYSKGNRFDQYTDQEYLDRRSDYTVLFFIDNDLGWYVAAGIYINGWAVVPPQASEQ